MTTATAIAAPATLDTTRQYEILDLIDIPVASIVPNPLNPRPDFHLAESDPELLALGQIATLPEASHPPVQRPLWLLQLCKRPPSPLAQAFLKAVQQPDGQA